MIVIIKYSQITQKGCIIFTILQKKKLGVEFIFSMYINIKVSTSWHYSFLWKWPEMSKVPNGSWQYFCNLLRRKCRRCTTFTYFTGVQSCSFFPVSQCFKFLSDTTLFDVAFCIFKLKDFKCSNYFMIHPFSKFGH